MTAGTLKIMPLGDSITYGWPVNGGYRTYLHDKLTTAGYNFDFVGALTNSAPPASRGITRIRHEGHGGWRIQDIARWTDGWLEDYRPDIITMMIGTNNVCNPDNYTETPELLDGLIGQITAKLPNVCLFAASITPFAPGETAINKQVDYANMKIPDIINKYLAAGRNVFFVDLHRVFDNAKDIHDNCHPNDNGYRKMAAAFFDAIEKVRSRLKVNMPSLINQINAGGIRWVSQHNGDGTPAKRNFSIAGSPISIGGIKYEKGIGTCTYPSVRPAEINIDIKGLGCMRFEAEVGMDDNNQVEAAGNTIFKILADGVVLEMSPVMTRGARSSHISAVIPEGSGMLTLQAVNNTFDTNIYPADWGNPIIFTQPSVFPGDMNWIHYSAADCMKPVSDGCFTNEYMPMFIRANGYAKGISTSVSNDGIPSDIVIDARNKGFTVIEADIGIEETMAATSGSIQYIILADTISSGIKEIFRSPVLDCKSPIYHIIASIPSDTDTLIFRVTGSGNPGMNSIADWANTMISKRIM